MTHLNLTDSHPAPIGKPVWLDILKFYGLGTVLALWAFWWFTQNASADANATHEKVDALSRSLQQHSADMHIDRAEQRAFEQRMLRATIAGCQLAAETPRERKLCGEMPK
jgi:hypothetical protein